MTTQFKVLVPAKNQNKFSEALISANLEHTSIYTEGDRFVTFKIKSYSSENQKAIFNIYNTYKK